MNLLPKCHEDFSKADYWNTFFQKRGKKAFEWYGEYPELCGILSKFVKPKDDILVVGCGNSKLSMDMHDVGYKNITSIDISKVVIDQMNQKNRVDQRSLVFEQMDATAMTYADDKFSAVIDKGTLDALMPDESPETLEKIDKFFSEIRRVLRRGGRYICFSLLQEHILRKLVGWFSAKDFMLRITRCHEAESKTREEEGSAIPVFAIMATKFPGIADKVLELLLSSGSPVRVANEEEMITSILAVQQSALVCNRLSKQSVADVGEVRLDLCQPGNDKPRYSVFVLDRSQSKGRSYVAFLVPQGRETDWYFSTPTGRKIFLEKVNKDRVAIVILGREHVFNGWEDIKLELSPSIRNLSPAGLPENYVIDYMSLGAEPGRRELVLKGESDISGSYMVEDIINDDTRMRRLVFNGSQFFTQSEAKMRPVKSRRGETKYVVEPGVLGSEHHPHIAVGINALLKDDEEKQLLIIGLGGGCLSLFFRHCYPKVGITTVDIDPAMQKVATECFDFFEDEKTKIVIEDGLKFINDAADNGRQFDGIIFDINGTDENSGAAGPPPAFLTPEFLERVKKCLKKNGSFVLNFVARDPALRPVVVQDLSTAFKSITATKMHDVINEVLICKSEPSGKQPEEVKLELREAFNDLNKRVRSRKLLTSDLVDEEEYFGDLKIVA